MKYRIAFRAFAALALPWMVWGATVPGRFIVELSTEPVADHIARTAKGTAMRSAAASEHRARVLEEQQAVRTRIEASATVLDSVSTVANALIVEGGDAAVLGSMPGVKKVYPVRTVKMLLDRAVVVNGIAAAWNQLTPDSAGAGVKIAIIDTGIDVKHAAFQDASLAVPSGFPRVDSSVNDALTNNKVIVARSYVSLLPSRDPDRSAQDRVGHGTALAMVAAGVRNAGPLATITGAAPKAWLGNYKVFGTPGFNDETTDDAILKAIDDAVADGMDVINLSLGYDIAPRLEDDVEVQAVERASRAGVIVVAAAGNNGSRPGTISSPATAPSVIAVGATRNDRVFAVTVEAAGLPPMLAVPGSAPTPSQPVMAAVVDVARFDGNGLACGTLPSGSLSGRVALIARGTCTFEDKLNHAQAAGAIAGLVYAAEDSPEPITMSVGGATLPAEMISFQDGAALRNLIGGGSSVDVTMRFTPSPVATDPNRVASFSAVGPSVDAGIKPDIVAVGTDMYVATQTLDPSGDMYDSTGYIDVGGTSFSAPLVAGAAALLKSARPGLTLDQYRSLLIDSAVALDGFGVQREGAGRLDAARALASTATAYPATLNFGAGGSELNVEKSLQVTNASGTAETYTVSVITSDRTAPALSTNSVEIAAGATATIPVSWQGSGLEAGGYQGFIRVTGTTSGTELNVPYWYGSTSDTPAGITVLYVADSVRRGGMSSDAILFRVTDASGTPVRSAQPEVTVVSGGGAVSKPNNHDQDAPGLFGVDLAAGLQAGPNVYRIRAGEVFLDVTVSGR